MKLRTLIDIRIYVYCHSLYSYNINLWFDFSVIHQNVFDNVKSFSLINNVYIYYILAWMQTRRSISSINLYLYTYCSIIILSGWKIFNEEKSAKLDNENSLHNRITLYLDRIHPIKNKMYLRKISKNWENTIANLNFSKLSLSNKLFLMHWESSHLK